VKPPYPSVLMAEISDQQGMDFNFSKTMLKTRYFFSEMVGRVQRASI
jgi:hypothetical protein